MPHKLFIRGFQPTTYRLFASASGHSPVGQGNRFIRDLLTRAERISGDILLSGDAQAGSDVLLLTGQAGDLRLSDAAGVKTYPGNVRLLIGSIDPVGTFATVSVPQAIRTLRGYRVAAVAAGVASAPVQMSLLASLKLNAVLAGSSAAGQGAALLYGRRLAAVPAESATGAGAANTYKGYRVAAGAGQSASTGAATALTRSLVVSGQVSGSAATGQNAEFTTVSDAILVSGDAQSGTDNLSLSGDAQAGSDRLLITTL